MLTFDPAVKSALPRGPQSRPHDGGARPQVIDMIGVADRASALAFDLGALTSGDIDILARGRAAGRQGLCPSLCPEVPGTREADLWHFGYEAAP